MDQFVFVIEGSRAESNESFAHSHKIGRRSLCHNARNSRKITRGDKCVGYLLGEAFRKSGGDRDGAIALEMTNGTAAKPAEIMNYLHESLLGSYLAFMEVEGDEWVFLDPFGSYPCVYDLEAGVIASTAYAALQSEGAYSRRFDTALMKVTKLEADDWLPSGTTAHRGLRRLLPNHGLRAGSLTAIRLWPKSMSCLSNAPALSSVIAALKASCEAAASLPGPVYLPLTAGYDSRTVLSAAAGLPKQIEAFTLHTNSIVDLQVARRLAELSDMPHHTLKIDYASDEQQRQWVHRNGHCVGGINMALHPTLDSFKKPSTLLAGGGGEVARAFYWAGADRGDQTIGPSELLLRMKLRPVRSTIESTHQWLKSLDGFDRFTILDLAYVEQRMGAWASPQRYSSLNHPVSISPFCGREYVLLALTASPEARRNRSLQRSIIEALRPDLSGMRFNSFGDWRDVYALTTKLHPTKVIRKMRQVLGKAAVHVS
jgi:hypothetical protein